MMPREPLSNVDTAWLRMEDPTHPMMITVALLFGAPLDGQRLRATFEQRLLRFRRFRQRVVHTHLSSDRPCWQDVSESDLDFHVQRVTLPPPGDQGALQDLISDLLGTPLDFTRPLWQFHLVEGYTAGSTDPAKDGCALVGRIHHCLADGPALLQVLLALSNSEPDGSWRATEGEEAGISVAGSPATAMLGGAAWVAEILARQGIRILRNPLQVWSLARLGSDSASALNRLLLRAPDPKTVFKGRLGAAKRVAWSEPMALGEVKAVGHMVGGTVNDVMLAAITGALRRYMQHRGDPVEGVNIRAGLSVNLRPRGTRPQPGNQAGAVLVSLPIGVANPLERLYEVKRRMRGLRGSPEGTMVHGLLNALGMASPETQNALVEIYGTRDTAMMANVRGPTEPISLAGVPLESLLFWVPAFGRVGLGLNVISYAGQVRLSVATDHGLVADPETIISEFHTEFEALHGSARQPRSEAGGIGAEESSVGAMAVMLEEAIQKLDAILAAREGRESAGTTD